MKEYLNHHLVESVLLNSSVLVKEDYLLYKCIKCNKYIYYTTYIGQCFNENELGERHWMYDNGNFKVPNVGPDVGWHFLTLTCEEELIKNLLE